MFTSLSHLFLFLNIFLMWTVLKSLLHLLQYCIASCCVFLAAPQRVGLNPFPLPWRWSLHRGITREVPIPIKHFYLGQLFPLRAPLLPDTCHLPQLWASGIIVNPTGFLEEVKAMEKKSESLGLCPMFQPWCAICPFTSVGLSFPLHLQNGTDSPLRKVVVRTDENVYKVPAK